MNMLLSVSLWLTLIIASCCGNVGSHEKEELTTAYYDNDYTTVTSTPDYYNYDYSHTVDYSDIPESEIYIRNKAAAVGQLNLVLLLGLAFTQIWN